MILQTVVEAINITVFYNFVLKRLPGNSFLFVNITLSTCLDTEIHSKISQFLNNLLGTFKKRFGISEANLQNIRMDYPNIPTFHSFTPENEIV